MEFAAKIDHQTTVCVYIFIFLPYLTKAVISIFKTSILFGFVALSLSVFGQINWQTHGISELSELATNHTRTLAQSERGVWIGGEPGIVFWDAASGNFERPEPLSLMLAMKMEYYASSLYVLTKAKQLLEIQLNEGGDVGSVIQLSPSGIIVNDFDISEYGLIMATAFSGVHKYQSGIWSYFNAGTSFLGNNSVKAVTWHGDLIAAATLGAVYLSDGSKRDSLNGLNGIQPYRMASRLGALYVATEYGIHVFESNGVNRVLTNDFIGSAVVSKFCFKNGDAMIATNKGLYQSQSIGWQRFVDAGQQGIRVSDALIFEDKLFIGYHADGLDIVHGTQLFNYNQTSTNWRTDQIFEWKGEVWGLVNSNQLFHFDDFLNRLKLSALDRRLEGTRQVITNGSDKAYAFTPSGCIDLETCEKALYASPIPAENIGSIKPFFNPEWDEPAFLMQGQGLYVLNDSGRFERILSSPFVQGMQIGTVKNDIRGNVYFKHDRNIYRWSKGDLREEGLFMDTLISFYDHDIQDYFFMQDYPIYQSWDYFLYDGPKEFIKTYLDEGYLNPGEAHFISDGRVFAVGENRDKMGIYALDSLRTLSYADMPFDAKGYKNGLVTAEKQICLGYEQVICYYQLDDYSIRPNKEALLLYPNPAGNYLYAELSIDPYSKVELSIQGMDGRVVYTEQFTATQIREKILLDLPHLNSGVYTLSLIGFGVTTSKSFVVIN